MLKIIFLIMQIIQEVLIFAPIFPQYSFFLNYFSNESTNFFLISSEKSNKLQIVMEVRHNLFISWLFLSDFCESFSFETSIALPKSAILTSIFWKRELFQIWFCEYLLTKILNECRSECIIWRLWRWITAQIMPTIHLSPLKDGTWALILMTQFNECCKENIAFSIKMKTYSGGFSLGRYSAVKWNWIIFSNIRSFLLIHNIIERLMYIYMI